MLFTVSVALSAGGLLLALPPVAFAQMRDPQSGHAPVNGLRMCYEIHCAGEPLILLHGGLGAGDMFSAIPPALTSLRRVITVDLQAHGRTADVDRPTTCEGMGDDLAALMRYLKIDKADVMGYSLGGGAALRLAIQHPDLINRLVIVSTPFRRDGWYPEVLAAIDQMGPAAAEPMKRSPIYKTYAAVAPRPEDWPVLVGKLGDLLKKDFDWSKEVAAIHAPTLLVFGDADVVRPAHMVEFFQLLGGGKKDPGWDGSDMSTARLAILSGVTHYNIFASPALGATVAQFLAPPH